MSSHASTNNFEKREAAALEACRASMVWFTKNKRIARNLYYTSQAAIITLSALTPVLILITDLPKWAQALPAALAAIAAAMSNSFNWKENWIRRSSTLEFMIAEQVRYETRASPAYSLDLSQDEALDNFVQNMTALNLMEVSNWERAFNKQATKEDQPQKGTQGTK